ncbi:MAG: hypothetical protein JSV68_20750 [Anaerolineaceae bacterium]|nr:MAG: hypothetical protein JSV68_20750 [Anaerolineaceae bacterium]
MQPRYSLIAIFLISILFVIFQLINTGPGLPSTSPPTVTTSYRLDPQVEILEAPVETSVIIPVTTEAAESPVTPQQDGSELLQEHCAQCHAVQLLEQSKKSRTDWEKTLSRMERIGMLMSDTERYVVLDYLTSLR